jgi:hypothetical protein
MKRLSRWASTTIIALTLAFINMALSSCLTVIIILLLGYFVTDEVRPHKLNTDDVVGGPVDPPPGGGPILCASVLKPTPEHPLPPLFTTHRFI